ncbi:ankyrin repeat domain-containing protein [Spiroplasma endosymbiont of Asaphidion curtum]|uniref:ankyrin repeat domain-containing protein n=1 Tax=Spiroplasma endosymbiont of Asaphidion curtum TaxID=3066281 RepID=UPI00313C376E
MVNNNDLTFLQVAIANHKIDIVKWLLANGANVDEKGKYDSSALYTATFYGDIDIVKLLLSHGADVNARNNNGLTPLHVAIDREYLNIVSILLDHGADVNAKDYKYDLTPLDVAKLTDHTEVINLLEKFVELNKKIIICNNLLQNTQYEEQKTKINNSLKETQKELKTLLKIELSNVTQQTDLREISDNNVKIMLTKKLISIFTNTEDKDKGGETRSKGSIVIPNQSTSNIPNIGGQPPQDSTSDKQNQNNLYDVPADNSCLFWSVSTSYLLSVRNNYEEFRNRFIQLFGEENLKYLWNIRKLLKNYDLINNRSLNQLWYQDQIANNLIINVFRNRVVDYIQSHLDTIPNHDNELTFRSLIQDNNDVDTNYLERMRQPSTWGGVPEIIAMSNLLNANISVGTGSPHQPVHQNANNNNIAISYVELEKGSGIHNHYNFALTPEEDQTNQPIVINDNQGNVPVVDITKRPDNLLPITPKPEANAIQLAVDDHGQRHATLANNSEDDANQGNNIAKAPEPTATPLQKDEYHFVDKKAEDDSLKNDENLEINLIKNNKDEIKQNAPVVNQPINTNMENLQTTTAKAINQYNALSKEEKLKRLNEINRYYQTLPENDKKAFKEKLTNTGLAALSGGALTAYGTKMTVSGTGTAATSVTNAEAMEMTPLLSTSTTESLAAAAETITVAETAAVEGGVIAGETGTAAALAPETLGLSLVIGGLAIAGTWMYFAFHHHATSDIVLPTSIHHNVYDNIEKWYKFLAHDKLKIKINKNTWNEIKQNKNSQANIIKIIKNKFVINDHSGWGGSVTNEDFNTFVKVIVLHFEQINGYFEILDNENDGFVIITNTEGDWLGIE